MKRYYKGKRKSYTMELESTDVMLYEGERIDELQRNNYKIIQNDKKFCFGMDAVLLSGFATVKKGEKALDLGTGTGIIPILLEAKYEGIHYTGLEIQEESADMARRSVALNHIESKVSIVTGDIKEASKIFGGSSHDVVTCNPPYMTGSHGLVNKDMAKTIARHEVMCTFEDVAREASKVLRPNGRFYLVHRPFRLAELMITLTQYKLEPKRLMMVHPFIDKEPNMVLIECVKGGKSRIQIEPPFIVYKEPGVYTDAVYDTYGY